MLYFKLFKRTSSDESDITVMDKVVFVLLHFISIFIIRRSFARPEQTFSILFYCSLMLCDDVRNESMKIRVAFMVLMSNDLKQTNEAKLTKG